MKLDEKGLEAAWAVYHGSTNNQRGALSDAIRAYLTSATPPDVATLVEKLEKAKWAITNGKKPDWDAAERAIEDAATALRLSAGGGVPEGWKLVPVEPTPEMIGSGGLASFKSDMATGLNVREGLISAYKAMLAASPTAPAEGA